MKELSPVEKQAQSITKWVGSPVSILVHTILFALSFLLALIGIVSFDRMLLVLTTVVSLEAIYLAIFIQMSVNLQGEVIQEVEQDLEEIQEDVEEIQEDIEDIQEDVEEIGEDVEEIQEDVEEIGDEIDELEESDEVEKAEVQRQNEQKEALENIYNILQELSGDIEKLKQK